MTFLSPQLGEPLTWREHQVGFCILFGRTSKQTAALLGISLRTVDCYRQRLLRKFGVATSPKLVCMLLRGDANDMQS